MKAGLCAWATSPTAFWPDHPDVLAGRDTQRQGTWLGITRTGRVAFVTNFKEGGGMARSPRTRGDLTVDFLLGKESPMAYLKALDMSEYSGFNLVVADLVSKEVAYQCNRGDKTPRTIKPGVHALSNGHIDDIWPKMQASRDALLKVLRSGKIAAHLLPWESIFNDVLGQAKMVQDESLLPNTGVDKEIERLESGVFVHPYDKPDGLHGTRSQTVLAVWRDGHVDYCERSLDFPNNEWHEVKQSFVIAELNDRQDKHCE